jgi:hypothetical protein
MGLSFRPGDAQWDYIGYSMFRKRLAALDGIELDKMRGFTEDPLPRDWEDYPTALEPLLNSSDVHGFISGEDCRKMLPRLRVVAEQWTAEPNPNDNEAFDLQALRSLISGIEHCADHGCALAYG